MELSDEVDNCAIYDTVFLPSGGGVNGVLGEVVVN